MSNSDILQAQAFLAGYLEGLRDTPWCEARDGASALGISEEAFADAVHTLNSVLAEMATARVDVQ